jgi:DNA mismatch endonuclease, patch repair protein
MSKSKNTKPETMLQESLRIVGKTFSLHDSSLPGTPDIVFPDEKLAVFVHGCYWHRHYDCQQHFSGPALLWKKIRQFNSQVDNDELVLQRLRDKGWEAFIAWECHIYEDSITVAKSIEKVVEKRA